MNIIAMLRLCDRYVGYGKAIFRAQLDIFRQKGSIHGNGLGVVEHPEHFVRIPQIGKLIIFPERLQTCRSVEDVVVVVGKIHTMEDGSPGLYEAPHRAKRVVEIARVLQDIIGEYAIHFEPVKSPQDIRAEI